MTTELTLISVSITLGALAGTLYFGGLWLTVRHISAARRPRLRLALSFILRMGALLTVFYNLANQGMGAMIAAMAGVLAARQLWLHGKGRIRPVRG